MATFHSTSVVMFSEKSDILATMSRRVFVVVILCESRFNGVCLGIGGSGRASATKLAAFMSDYELFQIEITKTYTFTDWREDVKKMLRKAGFEGVSTVFLFGDHQLKVSIKASDFGH